MRLTLKLLLALGLAFGAPAAVHAQAQPAPAVAATSGKTELVGRDDRKISVSVFPAAQEQAVIVFGHGLGGTPEAYRRIIDRWTANGFTVLAPLHVDSLQHPNRAAFDRQSGYMARLEDVSLTIAEAERAHPGKPVVAAGHSYGSYFSMVMGGAATPFGSRSNPAVKAVVGLSSAGAVPGLVNAETYTWMTTPTLIVTGDQDLVPGLVTDWRDHRRAFDQSPEGGKYLLIFEGGDHSLPRNADPEDFELMATVTLDFMRAHALRDRAAWDRLKALQPSAGASLERR